MQDFFNARDTLNINHRTYTYYRLDALEKAGLTDLKRLPFSIRIVLEAALRQCNEREIPSRMSRTSLPGRRRASVLVFLSCLPAW